MPGKDARLCTCITQFVTASHRCVTANLVSDELMPISISFFVSIVGVFVFVFLGRDSTVAWMADTITSINLPLNSNTLIKHA